jgi:hypothetical protein
MTVSEYEERFWPPAPSVHQALIDMHGPKWTRRRRRRLWIAAALLGLMTATMETALYRTADTDPGQGSPPLQAHIRWASDRGMDCSRSGPRPGVTEFRGDRGDVIHRLDRRARPASASSATPDDVSNCAHMGGNPRGGDEQTTSQRRC